MRDESGIYSIRNKVNGRLYVGSAVNIRKRWNTHRSKLLRNIHYNRALQAAWNKYGPEAFDFSVLEVIDDTSKLIEREQHWIDSTKSQNKGVGYNLTPCAGSRLGSRHSEEQRRARSILAKRSVTAEHLNMMCAAARTPEARAKKRAAHQRWLADPVNKAIKLSQLNSVAAREKMRNSKTGRPGRPLTDTQKKALKEAWLSQLPEIRLKLSSALKGRKFSPEWRAKISAALIGNKNQRRRRDNEPLHSGEVRGTAGNRGKSTIPA